MVCHEGLTASLHPASLEESRRCCSESCQDQSLEESQQKLLVVGTCLCLVLNPVADVAAARRNRPNSSRAIRDPQNFDVGWRRWAFAEMTVERYCDPAHSYYGRVKVCDAGLQRCVPVIEIVIVIEVVIVIEIVIVTEIAAVTETVTVTETVIVADHRLNVSHLGLVRQHLARCLACSHPSDLVA